VEELQLLIDLHLDGDRQGPGSKEDTLRAIDLAGLNPKNALKIADIGCGTGASTLVLAETLKCEIVAVDFIPEFLETLSKRASKAGLQNRIALKSSLMEALHFNKEEFDVIWSEGAIYNIGFKRGVREWRPFLKTGGILAVSEITWLTRDRPREIQDYWQKEYPEIALASEKIAILEQSGYETLGYFPLKPTSWTANYYQPLESRFKSFLSRHSNSIAAQDLIKKERAEIELFEKFHDYYSYGFYIAKKL
jgi:ubiquinone/menaquinone biosynthesis C-methylase UbiE